MRINHSYEDWGTANIAAPLPDLLEVFSGSSIVRWAETVKFKLDRMAQDMDANRNEEYARLIRNFLNTWEANQITGSINRETLEVLKAAAGPLSVMKWPSASYFQGLSTSLNELIADQEQLPTGQPQDQDTGGMGAGFSAPPMGDDFGPEKEPPLGGEDEDKDKDKENPLGEPGGAPGGPGEPAGALPTH